MEHHSLFQRVVRWQRQHGRQHLPWQGTHDPYRVWLSEVMLQQTQVATVLDYFPRFLARFPDVAALAAAPLDDVLALWSGLGYYSRARNLHRCAQAVAARPDGRFPRTAAELAELPGIGPSTAAAIAAFCFGERVSILDGNVKRVLSRVLAFEGDLASARELRTLWDRVQALVDADASHADMVAWTQGLMDLGAGLCARSRPDCAACPLARDCQAHAQGREAEFPRRTRKLVRRHESWYLLALWRPDGAVALVQRPARGIWSGLFAPPVFANEADLLAAVAAAGIRATSIDWPPARGHALTHRELMLHLAHVRVGASDDWPDARWASPADWAGMGLPAPVRSWLNELASA